MRKYPVSYQSVWLFSTIHGIARDRLSNTPPIIWFPLLLVTELTPLLHGPADMVELAPIFKKAYWSLAFLGGIYAILILLLTNEALQRQCVTLIHSGLCPCRNLLLTGFQRSLRPQNPLWLLARCQQAGELRIREYGPPKAYYTC